MTAFSTLDLAHDALRRVVAGVPADAWSAPTPCSDWTVTQVLQHATGDQLAYAMFITGTGGPTFDPFAPSGHIDGDPNAFVADAVSASATAFGGVDPTDEEVPTPLPQGALPAAQAAGAAALDAAVHAWDIAVATGQRSPITPDLARELLPIAHALVEPLREYGAYAAALEPATDSADVVLLNYLGRDAGWAAA
jgi:uncharacterized protein (TIGR03086 family)